MRTREPGSDIKRGPAEGLERARRGPPSSNMMEFLSQEKNARMLANQKNYIYIIFLKSFRAEPRHRRQKKYGGCAPSSLSR